MGHAARGNDSFMSGKEVLESFTIYKNPIDYHGKFVVRRFDWDLARELVGVVDSLEEAQALIPNREFMQMIPRHPMDHKSVVETWI